MILDLFAGPGGWSTGLHYIGLHDLGLEHDPDACRTRRAAGHLTIRTDIAAYPAEPFRGAKGLIASPPCQAFSAAGTRAGEKLVPELLEAIEARNWTARPDPDPRVWLVLDVGRWIDTLHPEWIALEQVPPVLPLWRAYARHLDHLGYSTWTGILNAADYGVPQTRKRAFLLASRARTAGPPEPTHSSNPAPTLFGTLKPWATMAEALRWEIPDGAGWNVYTGLDWRPDGTSQTFDPALEPARAFTAKSGGQWQLETPPGWAFKRPATTIAGDSRCWPPGHKINADDKARLGDEEAERRYSNRAGTDAIRLTIRDALLLQTFPETYPVQGTKTAGFRQIGDAVPPLLAAHILATLTGNEPPPRGAWSPESSSRSPTPTPADGDL